MGQPRQRQQGCVYKPRDARTASTSRNSALEPPEGTSPAHSLTLGLPPQNGGELTSVVCGNLLRQP